MIYTVSKLEGKESVALTHSSRRPSLRHLSWRRSSSKEKTGEGRKLNDLNDCLSSTHLLSLFNCKIEQIFSFASLYGYE
jgi:hypothetical protein